MTRADPIVRFSRGFTLMEMLVAITVLLLLVIAINSMLSGVMMTWQQEQARGERRATARRALDIISRDLSLAAQPLNASDTTTLQFVIDPPSSDLSGYLAPHAMFWQAPVATDTSSSTQKGNLAVIGYFVRWTTSPVRANLCRLLINPSSSDYRPYTGTWTSSTLLDKYAPATSPDYQGLIGENVLGFWAQALDTYGNPIVKTASGTTYATDAYDSRQGYSLVANGTTHTYGPSALPASVRVGIVVIDSGTAKRMTARPTTATATSDFYGDIQSFLAGLPSTVRKGAESYCQLVSLPRVPQ